jgi:putative SOS response-associated peptidase YedK
MCYNITSALQTQLKRAIHNNNQDQITKILRQLEQYAVTSHYQLSGFAHNQLLIYTNESPNTPTPSIWGLIPSWVKNENQKVKLWNSTLNARGESIFDKPSFKNSAVNMRCVLYIDGFYEHHHYMNKKYPFLIQEKDNHPISLGGLYSKWTDKNTGEIINSFSIVTTPANELLSKIHNNPKLDEPRMPLILNEETEEIWLNNDTSEEFLEQIKAMITPNNEIKLKAHTVQTLNGKENVGNTIDAQKEYEYPELNLLLDFNPSH